MRWASAVSQSATLEGAWAEAAAALEVALDGARPDLVLAFVSGPHLAGSERLGAWAAARFPGARFAGCSGGGVIGGGREVELRPAVALMGAILPGVELELSLVDGQGPPPATPAGSSFLVLADPFTTDAAALLAALDRRHPGAVTVGGLASGGRTAGSNLLLAGERVARSGAVLLALRGELSLEVVVAQGCRPIGETMLVTRQDGILVHRLGERTPLEVLRALHETSPPRDRALMAHSLFLGVEMRDQREYHAGDFLIRNILGVDQHSGSMAVSTELEPWRAVQFHLRDRDTSAEDLRRRLEAARATDPRPPSGALLFSCLGRGEDLYGRPDHDSGLFQEVLGPAPLAGFFCSGEIGPVGGRTFLHGYTSVLALFRPRRP